MSAVGFEPTPYYGTAPKAAALDHSAKLTIHFTLIFPYLIEKT